MSVNGVRSSLVGGRPYCSRKEDSQRRSCRLTDDNSSADVVIARHTGVEREAGGVCTVVDGQRERTYQWVRTLKE